MKILLQRLSFILVALFASHSYAEYAVIVHPSNGATISEGDIAKLFLAKSKSFPDGKSATPVNQEDNSGIKTSFDKQILSKSGNQMKAYWSKLIFTGKAVPLQSFKSDADVIAHVAAEADAIGYVDAGSVTGDVKVVVKF